MNVLVLDAEENFIDYLDPDYIQIEEEHSKYGLRTISVEYVIEDIPTAKKLFKEGNKLLVINCKDIIDDCLYVINDDVKEDYFKENAVIFDAEEVLTELNYAPLFTQNELTAANGFKISTTNGKQEVTVDYNALLYWFGSFFNIGVVQECLSTSVSKVSITGTMNRMTLLRYLEEETGNVFVTRYELDVLSNVVHRYLDFLNPTSSNKQWVQNFEYDFIPEETYSGMHNASDDPIEEYDIDVEGPDDIVVFPKFQPTHNISPNNVQFRITDGVNVLNNKGEVYDENNLDDVKLCWNGYEAQFEESNHVVIQLSYKNGEIGVVINKKSFATIPDNEVGMDDRGFVTINNDPETITSALPDNAYFEIYDRVNERVLFKHNINPRLGTVHEEVLDLTRNVENIEFEISESDTFSAISPILSLNDDASSSISRTDLGKIITAWKNLAVKKGDIIPMIVEKVTLTTEQKNNLGTKRISDNYYSRPYKPNDNIDSSNAANSTYEYWRAKAYWNAPFTKYAGELHISNDTITGAEYTDVYGRADVRDERSRFNCPKMGNVETSDEDVYAIYNDVANKLKDKRDPKIDISVDVANYLNGKMNNYKVWDTVYVKVPDYEELITARVVKTAKNPHNIGENKVELGTYSINSKVPQTETKILGSNLSLKYPNQGKLQATLSDNKDVGLSNKLVSFAVYKVKENQTVFMKTYNKKTNANGVAVLPISLSPANYEIKVSFGGDLLYTSSTITLKVNVSGTVQKTVNTNATSKNVSATAKKSNAKTQNSSNNAAKTYYYDKFGRSPDFKYVCAIGLPSKENELKAVGSKFRRTVFKNYCPVCKTWHTLYWGWNFGTYFRNKRQDGSAQGKVYCDKCGTSFSIVYGETPSKQGTPKLQIYKKNVASSEAEAKKLKSGKVVYTTGTITIPSQKVTSNKTRTIPSNVQVSNYVKNLALTIVGDSHGWAAAKKIALWCAKNFKYSWYGNFRKSADTVLKEKKGNCCDLTCGMLTLMAAAGCIEYVDLKYVHVCCNRSNGYGHVFAKVTNRRDGGYVFVDPCKSNPWGHYVTSYGSLPARRMTNFPTTPF